MLAWVVVMDEGARERAYPFPGRPQPSNTFDLTREDPRDPSSRHILRCVIWAESDEEALRIARQERAELMLAGLWPRPAMPLPEREPLSPVDLHAAVRRAQQAFPRPDAARRYRAGRHQPQRTPLAQS